jgi:glycosyltransferase involved in cell wall biosynthesis
MTVGGFSLIRNAVRYDYPILEALRSVLPLVDELVVAVGDSDDGTEAYLQQIDSPKLRLLPTVWNPDLRTGGAVLAEETNKAFDALTGRHDWCLYIQGDECLHEEDYESIREAMYTWKDDARVEGLLFKYRHFYGTYDYIGSSRRWYRHEIRIVRHNPAIRSWKDAQGFRIQGRKLRVKPVDAHIYHYGMVRPPRIQSQYRTHFAGLWHDDQTIAERFNHPEEFDYSNIDALARYLGTHPAVMRERINRLNWSFHHDASNIRLPLKDRLLLAIARTTGWHIGEYRNYRLI